MLMIFLLSALVRKYFWQVNTTQLQFTLVGGQPYSLASTTREKLPIRARAIRRTACCLGRGRHRLKLCLDRTDWLFGLTASPLCSSTTSSGHITRKTLSLFDEFDPKKFSDRLELWEARKLGRNAWVEEPTVHDSICGPALLGDGRLTGCISRADKESAGAIYFFIAGDLPCHQQEDWAAYISQSCGNCRGFVDKEAAAPRCASCLR